MARPKRRRWSATPRARSSKPARWAGRCPAIASRFWIRTDAAQREGEICLVAGTAPDRADAGLSGRWRRHAAVRAETVYRTGDVAAVDDDGYLTYVGRADDVFKSSDYRISPFELESVLIEHPAVAEAAVVPSPDPIRLAVPKAFLVLAPGSCAGSRYGAVDLSALPRGARAIQAGAAARIRRSAEDDLRQNPPGRTCGVPRRRTGETTSARSLEFWEDDFSEAEIGRPSAKRI